jgi:hypothetical protein
LEGSLDEEDSLYLQVFRLCFFIGMLGKDSPLPFFYTGGRKGDVSEETRNVIEKLTGISYDKCFGNNNIGYKE